MPTAVTATVRVKRTTEYVRPAATILSTFAITFSASTGEIQNFKVPHNLPRIPQAPLFGLMLPCLQKGSLARRKVPLAFVVELAARETATGK